MKSRGNVLHECHYEMKFKGALLANGKVFFFFFLQFRKFSCWCSAAVFCQMLFVFAGEYQ